MDAVGWGIVGYGWVARDYMEPGIRAAGHRLVAVCDPNPECRAAAERAGARGHADLAGLIAEPGVEAVYVATPNHLHRGAVEALAAAGKAVLCEKPMAATLADAEAIARAVESQKSSTGRPSISVTTRPIGRSAPRSRPGGSAPSPRCGSSTPAGSGATGRRPASPTGGSMPPRPAAAP